jgi:SPASM domain peptide maturase of grasp-with-spasm system
MIYINLIPSSLITKGKYKSCLIDVEKSIYCIIPNSLADIFLEQKQFILNDVLNGYDNDNKEIFLEYILFLEENQFIIKSDKIINFKFYDTVIYSSPYKIETLILDAIDFQDIIIKIQQLVILPEFLQVRIFEKLKFEELEIVFSLFKDKNFRNIEILINHLKTTDIQYINLFNKYKIFSRFIIFNYESNIILLDKKIIAFSKNLINEKQCGIITDKHFMPNLRTYLSAKSCNSCLHKKISIDVNGNIKNCPSMPQSFGNIKDTTLEEALNHPDFKKYWNITKDMIEVCKDCEFRHICTDCRAYTERTHFQEDIDLSKPLKCGYNPYTNEWAEWSTNPLKQKAIAYYGMQELVKKDA